MQLVAPVPLSGSRVVAVGEASIRRFKQCS